MSDAKKKTTVKKPAAKKTAVKKTVAKKALNSSAWDNTTKSVARSVKPKAKKVSKLKASPSKFDKTRWDCPKCGTSNSANFKNCKRCGWVKV